MNRWVYRRIEMDADKQVGFRSIRDAASLGERNIRVTRAREYHVDALRF
jgi:hypothetical protein